MSKIKSFFTKMATNYKSSFKKYTATNILIILMTLFFVIKYNDLPRITSEILLIATVSGVGFFTCETYLKKVWQRVISYIVCIGIAVIFESGIIPENEMVCTGYVFSVFLIGLIKAIKNTEVDIGEYIIKVLKNLFNVGIIYTILNIGLTLILLIFMILILNNENNWDLMARLQIALLGFLVLPASLVAITEINNDISKFIKTIILYIMLPLTIIATAIIYIYMAKIFIIREIPSNAIYRILAGLFTVAFPIWVSIYTFKEQSKSIEKMCKILPIAFAPFILLQIYSIYTRIAENGLTPSRYIGVVFIIFEIIAIFLSLYKERKYLIHTITTAVILIVISTILPVVNMQSASYISQSNRLKKAWKANQTFNQLSDENKNISKSAYNYLIRENNSIKYIPSYIDDEAIKNYNKSDNYSYTNYLHYEYIAYPKTYGYSENEIIPIEEYKKIQPVRVTEADKQLNTITNISLTNSITVDLREYISKIVEEDKVSDKNVQEYIELNHKIKVDENTDFYITKFNLNYANPRAVYVSYLVIEGYILYK